MGLVDQNLLDLVVFPCEVGHNLSADSEGQVELTGAGVARDLEVCASTAERIVEDGSDKDGSIALNGNRLRRLQVRIEDVTGAKGKCGIERSRRQNAAQQAAVIEPLKIRPCVVRTMNETGVCRNKLVMSH